MVKPAGPSIDKIAQVAPTPAVERVRGELARVWVALQAPPGAANGLAVGDTVQARFVEALPDRRWVAQIRDSIVTLQWPAGADEAAATPPARGSALALQVASVAPRLSFVRLDAAAAPPGAAPAAAVQLSDAARTLSELARAGAAAVPGPIAPTVLLSDPAAPAAERAQQFAQAISHSGLFYESHLLAWTEGRLPLQALRSEPQARLAEAVAAQPEAPRDAASAELGRVVQRQLDALDGRPLAFSGEAWPGQPAQWQIQQVPARRDAAHDTGDRTPDGEPDERRGAEALDAQPTWSTQLRLVLPRLGALGADVRVQGTQVHLTLAADGAGAQLIAAHRERLASALEGAGLTLANWSLRPHAAPIADEAAP